MHSGSDGSYSFQELPLGMYRIHAEHVGLRQQRNPALSLHVADSLVINITLRVGAVSETVTVESLARRRRNHHGELTGLIQAARFPSYRSTAVTSCSGHLDARCRPPAKPTALPIKLKGGLEPRRSAAALPNGNQWLVDGANR